MLILSCEEAMTNFGVGKIVYTSWRDGNSEIFTLDVDGLDNHKGKAKRGN